MLFKQTKKKIKWKGCINGKTRRCQAHYWLHNRGVSPVGHLYKIKLYIDKNLERFSKVFAAAGHPNAVFGISYSELKRLTNAETDDLTEWDNQN